MKLNYFGGIIMTNLNDVAIDNDVILEDSIVFVKGEDDILAVGINNVGIKQRADDTMGIRFSLTPKQTKDLEKYFTKFQNGEKLYFNISQTGYRPVYYRGLSPITKEVSTEYESKFNVTVFLQKAIVVPDDNYFEPTCECCSFCHIG